MKKLFGWWNQLKKKWHVAMEENEKGETRIVWEIQSFFYRLFFKLAPKRWVFHWMSNTPIPLGKAKCPYCQREELWTCGKGIGMDMMYRCRNCGRETSFRHFANRPFPLGDET